MDRDDSPAAFEILFEVCAIRAIDISRFLGVEDEHIGFSEFGLGGKAVSARRLRAAII